MCSVLSDGFYDLTLTTIYIICYVKCDVSLFSSLFAKPPEYYDVYNKQVDLINEFIEDLAKLEPRLLFWKHQRLSHSWLLPDGVHLNPRAMRRYQGSFVRALCYAKEHYF